MDINTGFGYILAFLGILATWYFTKYSLRKKTLANFTRNEYAIGKSLSAEFPELKLTYNNTEVNNDLWIYRGIIMNTGHKDIADSPSNRIIVKLPHNYIVKDCKIKSKIDGVSYENSNNPNELILKFGLLQEADCFEYDIIYEIPEGEKSQISKTITFDFRIEDVNKKIDNNVLPSNTSGKRKKINGIIFVILTCAVFLSIIFYLFNSPLITNYYEKQSNTPIRVYEGDKTSYVITSGLLDIKFFGKKITKEEFNTQYYSELNENDTNFYAGVVIIIYTVFLLFSISMMYYRLWRDKKYLQIIEKSIE